MKTSPAQVFMKHALIIRANQGRKRRFRTMLNKKGYKTMLKKMGIAAISIAVFAMSAEAQGFPNYSAGTALNTNQVYQASSNGFIVVTAIGLYENSLSIYVGTTTLVQIRF